MIAPKRGRRKREFPELLGLPVPRFIRASLCDVSAMTRALWMAVIAVGLVTAGCKKSAGKKIIQGQMNGLFGGGVK